jgi:Region found in RelA / SpoT proteins
MGKYYTPPAYTREEVNKAGRRLVGDASVRIDKDTAIAIIHSWRLGHKQPLNGMYMSLKGRAPRVTTSAIVAQRLKRLESIEAKLARREVEKLTQIQDIGGCRVVFPTIAQVRTFAKRCSADSNKFRFHTSPKDYIERPKQTGYRSFHMIYDYVSDIPAYNGLKIELQIRTKLQHMWATAVETVSTFNRLPLKSGGIGADNDWSRFFVLASGAFASWEGTPRVPGTPDDDKSLMSELRGLVQKLKVHYLLNAWRTALKILPAKRVADTRAFLLILDVSANTFTYRALKERDIPAAEANLLEVEKTTGKDVVIVRVGSMANLTKAYPNYFADTQDFLGALGNALSKAI